MSCWIRLTSDAERRAIGEPQRVYHFAIGVQHYLRTESERSLEEQYIRGYLEHPETEEELDGWVEQASMRVRSFTRTSLRGDPIRMDRGEVWWADLGSSNRVVAR